MIHLYEMRNLQSDLSDPPFPIAANKRSWGGGQEGGGADFNVLRDMGFSLSHYVAASK